MSRFVLDRSIAMSWCFEDQAEPGTDAILARLTEDEALVPPVWPLEVANVLLGAERRGRLSRARSQGFVAMLGQLPIATVERPQRESIESALSLGRDYCLSAYDAAYLDLAIREGVPLASKDRLLRTAARRAGVALLPER